MRFRTCIAMMALVGLLLVALVAVVSSPASLAAPAAPPLYVKPDGSYSGTCDSWGTACALQHALIVVAAPGDDIWVAAGTYNPGSARWDTFQLRSGVAIYGGFAGTEDELDQRNQDPATNGTVLSGDLWWNDPGSIVDNSYHVVTGSDTDATAVLDGFTIRGGNADGDTYNGGGMVNVGGSPTLGNLIFSDNRAEGHGAGIYNENSSPTLTNCQFTNNVADSDDALGGDGGGMYNGVNSSPVLSGTHFFGNAATYGGGMHNGNGSNPSLTNVTFSGNTAQVGGGMDNRLNSSPQLSGTHFYANTAWWGGGMHNENGSNPNLTGCELNSNAAVGGDGGGMHNGPGSNPVLADTRFISNTATVNGGGMANLDDSNPELTIVTFSGNQAANHGGGMYNWQSSPTLIDCQFTSNGADSDSSGGGDGGGMYNTSSSSPVLSATHFYSNTATYGGGMNNNFSSPTLTGCEFSGNSSGYGAGMSNGNSHPTLTDVTFSGNQAANRGGGMYNWQSSPTLIVCQFTYNVADSDYPGGYGAGMYNELNSSPVLSATHFYTNTARLGGGMHNENSSNPTLTGCTFSGNTAGVGGGMCNKDSSNPTLTDCELSGNQAASIGGGIANDYSTSTLTGVTFSGNTSGSTGGGISNHYSGSTLAGVTFSGNTAGAGGGMYTYNSGLVFTGCEFGNNTATGGGGGMVSVGGSLTLSDTKFISNTAGWHGGGIYDFGSSPTLTNCQFANNVADSDSDADGDGGGMWSESTGSPVLSGTHFYTNTANYGGGMHSGAGSNPTLTNVTFRGNSANGDGGGMHNYPSSSPALTNTVFISNTATLNGGGMSNGDSSSPMLRDVTFSGNSAGSHGGGIYNYNSSPTLYGGNLSGNSAQVGGGMYNYTSSPVLTGTRIFRNTADANGGGMYNDDSSSPQLFHSLLSGNEAGDSGGGMYNAQSSPRLLLSTFSANGAAVEGGGLANVDGSSPVVANSILWGTSASPVAQIWSDVTSTPVVSYTLVQGGYPTGTHIIDADPHFADADGPDGVYGTLDDDLHVTCSSPALDGGDNSLVPPGVTTDLDGLPRFRGLGEPVDPKPPVDLGPYEEQDYGQWVSEGWTNLHEGQVYRTGFHTPPISKTIGATILDYQPDYFVNASDKYEQALTCAPVQVRRTEAGTGLLDARWELATGEMLLGNEAMVQIQDLRFAAQHPSLGDQIAKVVEARDHFTRAVEAYLEILPGDLYTVAMELQPSRTDPLPPDEGALYPYLDVQRLAEASARKARAYVELAKRQFRQYDAAGKAQAEATLREGFDQATAELALLDHLAQGWAEVDQTSAYQVAYQELSQSIADMQGLFSYLKEGKTPFGFEPSYVPFYVTFGTEGNPNEDNNFVAAYDEALEDWSAADDAYDSFNRTRSDLDDNENILEQAMIALDREFSDRLVELCGTDPLTPTLQYSLENCHLIEGGKMHDQLGAIEDAYLRVEKAQVQMENQLSLIRIEQQRAARVAGIHRATAVMYTSTGEELSSLAREEVELEQSEGFFESLGGMWTGFITGKAMKKTAFGPKGPGLFGPIGIAVSAVSSIGGFIEGQKKTGNLADIADKREEIKAHQQAQVMYAEAQIDDANSEALIQQLMLDFATLRLDQAIALNELQRESARLEGMVAEIEYLLARWNEANRDYTELYRDPGSRILRDEQAETASQLTEIALEAAYEAGRALDFEAGEDWSGWYDCDIRAEEVYGIGNPVDLDTYLFDMDECYDNWGQGGGSSPHTAELYVSQLMGFVDSVEKAGGDPVTAQDKFNTYVRDPSNWVDLYPTIPGESLQLTFQTSIFQGNPYFDAGSYNDKIKNFAVVLSGDEAELDSDGNGTLVRLGQYGTSVVRASDAWKSPGYQDHFTGYDLAPHSANVEALINDPAVWDPESDYWSPGHWFRSVHNTKWILTIDRELVGYNEDLSFEALDDIELIFRHSAWAIQPGTSESDGEPVPASADLAHLASPVTLAGRAEVSSAASTPDASFRFEGSLMAGWLEGLPPLSLALALDQTGSDVTGAIDAEGVLGYPVPGPALAGTVVDGHYALTSGPFTGAGGITRTLTLTTTAATPSTIGGEYAEKILGLLPQDLEVQGVYTLTRSADQPLAGFSASPATGPAPLPVTFTDWSEGDPTSWAWGFGDGATSTVSNTTHIYDLAGLYTVTLTVSNLFGSDTLTETGYISVTEPAAPVAYFEASPTSGPVPLEVTFTDWSAGGPTGWEWAFGDGDFSTQQSPTHTYDLPGLYTVILTATNGYGSHTRTKDDYITVTEPQPPEAGFSASPTSGLAPLVVTFTDQSSNDPTSWDWAFGDGGTSTDQDPEHTYTAAGTFTVTLTATNNWGSDALTKPDYIAVTEAEEKVYLPLVLRNAP